MSKFILNERTGKMVEYPPYKCKMCGMGNIFETNEICEYCGWEDDWVQNNNLDYAGGANQMSHNQYREFWEENKEEILSKRKDNQFIAIEKSQECFEIKFMKK